MLSFSFIIIQVVGGIDDQIPSLPSSTGVKVVTYSKLLSQVILFFLMNQPNPWKVLGDLINDLLKNGVCIQVSYGSFSVLRLT